MKSLKRVVELCALHTSMGRREYEKQRCLLNSDPPLGHHRKGIHATGPCTKGLHVSLLRVTSQILVNQGHTWQRQDDEDNKDQNLVRT